jgi:hypothetical protein
MRNSALNGDADLEADCHNREPDHPFRFYGRGCEATLASVTEEHKVIRGAGAM